MKSFSLAEQHSSTEPSADVKETRLELLASLLAATLDGQPSTQDVRSALNSSTCDEERWRVRMAECAHARESTSVGAEAGSSSAAAAVSAPTQEWICPMCETVNWAPDARKSLRRRPGESAPASLSSSQLQCVCCGYGGGKEEEGEDGQA